MTPSPNSGGKGEVEVVKTHSGDCHWWTYKVCDCGWLMRANSGDFGDPSDQVIKDFLTHSENCQHSLHLSDLLDRIKVLERWRRRLEWLHDGCEKDSEGYEWGVARVKFDEHGKVASFLWTDSDHKDLDAEIERTSK